MYLHHIHTCTHKYTHVHFSCTRDNHKSLYNLHHVCECVCICMWIHTYMHAYLHTYMHPSIHTCKLACISAYLHTYMRAHILIYMHAYFHSYRHACLHNSFTCYFKPTFSCGRLKLSDLVYSYFLSRMVSPDWPKIFTLVSTGSSSKLLLSWIRQSKFLYWT
jgi:hypothetical protein